MCKDTFDSNITTCPTTVKQQEICPIQWRVQPHIHSTYYDDGYGQDNGNEDDRNQTRYRIFSWDYRKVTFYSNIATRLIEGKQ